MKRSTYDAFGQDIAEFLNGALERENIYRGGQLLATWEYTPTNIALVGSVSASSSHSSGGYEPDGAINGDRTGNSWGSNGGWNDGTRNAYPDTLEVDFPSATSINQINVYTLQNNWKTGGDPDSTTSASAEGILDFIVQYWNQPPGQTGQWQTVPGGNVTGNDKALRLFTFSAVSTTKIRVVVNTHATTGVA